MPEKSGSPFSGLDKALLRSTQQQPPTPRADPDDDAPEDRSSGRPTRRPQQVASQDERSNERTNIRTRERFRIRHSFDIYHDQLLSLSEIQAALFKKTGRKPKVGELVQEALDAYIKRAAGRPGE